MLFKGNNIYIPSIPVQGRKFNYSYLPARITNTFINGSTNS